MNKVVYSYNTTDIEKFCANDPAEVQLFMEGYVRSATADLQDLLDAWTSDDLQAVKSKAHKMKNILSLLNAQPHTVLAELLVRESIGKIKTENGITKFETAMRHLLQSLQRQYGLP
jgi:hypothetical protein